jgi:hypothetical protein
MKFDSQLTRWISVVDRISHPLTLNRRRVPLVSVPDPQPRPRRSATVTRTGTGLKKYILVHCETILRGYLDQIKNTLITYLFTSTLYRRLKKNPYRYFTKIKSYQYRNRSNLPVPDYVKKNTKAKITCKKSRVGPMSCALTRFTEGPIRYMFGSVVPVSWLHCSLTYWYLLKARIHESKVKRQTYED